MKKCREVCSFRFAKRNIPNKNGARNKAKIAKMSYVQNSKIVVFGTYNKMHWFTFGPFTDNRGPTNISPTIMDPHAQIFTIKTWTLLTVNRLTVDLVLHLP